MTIHLITPLHHPHKILKLFKSVSITQWSILLQNRYNNNYPNNQFNILMTNPSLILITKNNTIIYYKNKHITSIKESFILLQKYIKFAI